MRQWFKKWMAAAAVAGVAGAAHGADGGDALKALYDQARAARQTQVVVYTPYGNLQPVWNKFAGTYPGITVQPAVISGGGAPLLARTRAEAASGNYIGDIVLSGLGDINTLIAEDRLERDEPPQAATLDAQFKDPAGRYQIPFHTLFTIVYNPNLIKESELPASFDEAIGSKWAGRYGHARFTGAAAPDLVGTILSYNNALTDDQLRQLKANAQVSPTAIALLTNVAQGRVAFGLWGPTQNVRRLQQDGAPLKIHFLPDSAVVMGPGLALLKNAPNQHAARLLKAWLLSEAGQAALGQEASSYGTQPTAPTPEGLPDIGGYRFKGVPLAEYDAALKAFRERTVAIWGR